MSIEDFKAPAVPSTPESFPPAERYEDLIAPWRTFTDQLERLAGVVPTDSVKDDILFTLQLSGEIEVHQRIQNGADPVMEVLRLIDEFDEQTSEGRDVFAPVLKQARIEYVRPIVKGVIANILLAHGLPYKTAHEYLSAMSAKPVEE